MRHTLISRNAAALLMAIAILASTLAATGRPVQVTADLGDGHTRANPHDEFTQSKTYQLDEGRITRNLVKGETLTVCSDVFPEATEDAVERWNDKLSREVLTFEKDSVKCQNARQDTGWIPRQGVKTVFVSVGEVTTDQMGETIIRGNLPNARWCVGTPIACVRQDGVDKNGVWRTRFGRMEVIVNPTEFCRDTGIPGGTPECSVTQDDDELRYLITHELGHALSLGDYYCNHLSDAGDPHPDFVGPNMKTVMNSFSLRRKASPRECNAPNGKPTDHDKNDYVKIYTPAVVVVDGHGVEEPEVVGQTVTLHWNQSNVFVESDFEIQRKNGAIWEMEEIADTNAESITLANQPGGEQRYQIVARTKALPAQTAGEEYFYGKASAEIVVSVPLPAPTGPTVGTRTPVRLELSWTAGVGASFHEVKATTRANCDLESETYETPSPNSATSHALTGLTPNTPYRLCVRSVRTIGSDSVKSAWADTTAATPAKLAAPSTRAVSNSDITTNSITLRWSAVTDADGYEVKATTRANCNEKNETYGTPNPKDGTSHPFPGLTSNTSYRLCVRATLDAHSAATSAWASRSARTSTPPSPPPVTLPPPRPTGLAATSTTNSLTFSWNAAARATSYEVKRGASGTVATVSSGRTYTFSGLTADTSYTLYVLAKNSGGRSAWASITARTSPLPPITLLPPIDCLSSTAVGASATYAGNCDSVWASSLLDDVRVKNPNACGIWRLRDGDWRDKYGVSDNGRLVIPGSADYTINVGDFLWLAPGDCNTASGSGGVGGASSNEPPSCPDALKPSSGPTVIDADSTDCATVRGGGAVQISRGDYTLSLTLPSDRDWWGFAPTSYHDNPSGAFIFLDLASGGWLALNPATAAELARHTPADAEGLSALLDAIAASASVPATE